MLRLDQVTYAYKDMAFQFDLAVKEGSLVGVVGPSGAGKSTLLALVAGFIAPASGTVLWHGERLDTLPPAERPVSMIFQENNLFAHLDVATNIALGLSPTLKLSDKDRGEIAIALARVGLSGFDKRFPDQLSGGERQRVAIARALVRDRSLLLLDEPFAALGPVLRTQMLELVQELRQEKNLTVLLVSHHPAELESIASQMAFIDKGRVAIYKDAGDFFATTDNQALKDYQGSS